MKIFEAWKHREDYEFAKQGGRHMVASLVFCAISAALTTAFAIGLLLLVLKVIEVIIA